MAPTTSPFCAALCGNLTVELGVAAERLNRAPMGGNLPKTRSTTDGQVLRGDGALSESELSPTKARSKRKSVS